MYTFYNLTIANATEQYTLTYELKTHKPAQIWANIMTERPFDSLRPSFNPWQGVKTDITVLVNKLLDNYYQNVIILRLFKKIPQ